MESAPGTRPHRLDERVLSIVSEALDADSAAFDADVTGDSDRIRATFDVLADDAEQAAASARALFAGALRAAIETTPEGLEIVDRVVVEPVPRTVSSR
ncbi:MAG TPA: hypothetical protein VFM96_15095 [Gaiellaceae bacterium]|nr:hypothetical protein [Gaiellaceae bacterium]